MFKLFRLKFGIIHLFQLINNSFKVGVDIFEAVEIEIGFVNIYHLVEHIFLARHGSIEVDLVEGILLKNNGIYYY